MQLGSLPLNQVVARLPEGFLVDPQIGFETITSTTRYRIKYAPLPFTIEMFELSDDAHDQLRFRQRIATTYNGVKAFLPRPEDVIITKLRRGISGQSRLKDEQDVANVLAVQTPGKLDLGYIREWADKHGTRELFERLLRETPVV